MSLMLIDCHPLLGLLMRKIAKADDELKETLENAGFVNADAGVKLVSSLTDSLEEIIDKFVQEAAKKAGVASDSESMEDYSVSGKDKQKLTESIVEAMQESLLSEFGDTVSAYLKKDNEKLELSTVSLGAVDSVFSAIDELAKSMAERVSNSIGSYIEEYEAEEKSASGIEDDLFASVSVQKAMNAQGYVIAALMTMHSIAQHEAIMQNPAATGSMWKHTANKKIVPRRHHKKLDGTVIKKGEKFKLNPSIGLTYECEYPRQMSLPASEKINCHCMEVAVIDNDILASDIESQTQAQEEAIEAMNNVFKKDNKANKEAIERAEKFVEENFKGD